jgi:ribonuclease BN (tRNA processing enzyme)
MTQAFFEYMKLDIDVRIMDEGRPDPRKLIFAHDFVKPGIIMQNANAKVTATKVRHPLVKQAFAFRFDTKDRSIVISGDTAYSPELISLAKRADILVHEVMYIPALEALIKRVPNAARFREHLLASHSTPEDVGRVASQAGVKTVVLTHFVPGDDPSLTDEQWTEGVRRYFKGQIIVGKDLMEI